MSGSVGGEGPNCADVVARLSLHERTVSRVVFSSSYRALMLRSYMETLYYSRIQSPVGTLILGVSAKGLVALEFDRGQFPPKMNKSVSWQESKDATRDYVDELNEYFAGRRRKFTFVLDLRGTPFQIQCWRALLDIPYGETRTYADIARSVGRPH